MSDELKDIMESSGMALWSAYLDKKMELEDANDRIEMLENALRIADKACFNYWSWEYGNSDSCDASLLVAWRHDWNNRTNDEQ